MADTAPSSAASWRVTVGSAWPSRPSTSRTSIHCCACSSCCARLLVSRARALGPRAAAIPACPLGWSQWSGLRRVWTQQPRDGGDHGHARPV
jgi:hypothetical protein